MIFGTLILLCIIAMGILSLFFNKEKLESSDCTKEKCECNNCVCRCMGTNKD
jgi:hypothetical protein